ncbi:MAG: hypothetical protein ABFR97_11310 [Thermodesulfobacteriota bacterium]
MQQISRAVGVVICSIFVLTMFAGVGVADSLSNKWRIKVNHKAKSDGTIVFRMTPKGQAAKEISVNIKDGTRENRVANTIENAFRKQMPDGYKVERDDFEDVLVKKRLNAPRFGLELVTNTVKRVNIRMHKE